MAADGVLFTELPTAHVVDSVDYLAVLSLEDGILKKAEVETVVPDPVDVVEEGNMKYVTSNAVARDVGNTVDHLEEELDQAVSDLHDDIQQTATDLQTSIDDATNQLEGEIADTQQNLDDAVQELQTNFQAGVDSVYDAIVARGTTPASKSLSDVVTGIGQIQTTHTQTYTFASGSTGATVDLGVKHFYRYVNATNVYNKGKSDATAYRYTFPETYCSATSGGDTVTKTVTINHAGALHLTMDYSFGGSGSTHPSNQQYVSIYIDSTEIYYDHSSQGSGGGDHGERMVFDKWVSAGQVVRVNAHKYDSDAWIRVNGFLDGVSGTKPW